MGKVVGGAGAAPPPPPRRITRPQASYLQANACKYVPCGDFVDARNKDAALPGGVFVMIRSYASASAASSALTSAMRRAQGFHATRKITSAIASGALPNKITER